MTANNGDPLNNILDDQVRQRGAESEFEPSEKLSLYSCYELLSFAWHGSHMCAFISMIFTTIPIRKVSARALTNIRHLLRLLCSPGTSNIRTDVFPPWCSVVRRKLFLWPCERLCRRLFMLGQLAAQSEDISWQTWLISWFSSEVFFASWSFLVAPSRSTPCSSSLLSHLLSLLSPLSMPSLRNGANVSSWFAPMPRRQEMLMSLAFLLRRWY
jgi:hypothetical protein